MQKNTTLILLLVMVLLTGCETLPTKQQMDAADYGLVPVPESAIRVATAEISKTLIDPYSAKINCKAPVKGVMNKTFENHYGYLTVCYVNAKNRFGAYTGITEYFFWSRDGRIEPVEPPFEFNPAE